MTSPQEQFAEAARQGQEAVAQAIRTWSESVQRLTRAMPSGGEQAPSLADVVDNAYAFAEQLLATQREFTHSLLQAVTPGLASVTEGAKAGARATEETSARTRSATEAAAGAAGETAQATRRTTRATSTAAKRSARKTTGGSEA